MAKLLNDNDKEIINSFIVATNNFFKERPIYTAGEHYKKQLKFNGEVVQGLMKKISIENNYKFPDIRFYLYNYGYVDVRIYHFKNKKK